MIVWRNPQVAQAIREGLDQAERGETVDRGSFSQYADQAADDED